MEVMPCRGRINEALARRGRLGDAHSFCETCMLDRPPRSKVPPPSPTVPPTTRPTVLSRSRAQSPARAARRGLHRTARAERCIVSPCPVSTEGWTRRVHFVRGGALSPRARLSGRVAGAALQAAGVQPVRRAFRPPLRFHQQLRRRGQPPPLHRLAGRRARPRRRHPRHPSRDLAQHRRLLVPPPPAARLPRAAPRRAASHPPAPRLGSRRPACSRRSDFSCTSPACRSLLPPKSEDAIAHRSHLRAVLGLRAVSIPRSFRSLRGAAGRAGRTQPDVQRARQRRALRALPRAARRRRRAQPV